jgi:phosphotransacetylase
MSRKQKPQIIIKPKLQSKAEAAFEAAELVKRLSQYEIRFSLQAVPDKNLFLFTVVSNTHQAKAIVPEFEIQQDTRKELYGALRIEYE